MLVAGEAGVGKTTLVRRSARSVVNPRGSSGATAMRWSRRVHSGRCSMSRGLGRRAGRGSGECGDAARGGGRAAGELRRRAPTVFVLDDVHWADEATLDVLRLLARRVETVPALVIRLRKRAARAVPRGPRAQTRENPAGLTARELDVIVLVAEGLRNIEIAERLVVSEKTADHHVSAILGKLDVQTRGEAAAEAVRLGLTARR